MSLEKPNIAKSSNFHRRIIIQWWSDYQASKYWKHLSNILLVPAYPIKVMIWIINISSIKMTFEYQASSWDYFPKCCIQYWTIICPFQMYLNIAQVKYQKTIRPSIRPWIMAEYLVLNIETRSTYLPKFGVKHIQI